MFYSRHFRILTCSLVGLSSQGVLSQQLPDAGTQLRQITPVPQPLRPAPELRIQSPDAPVQAAAEGGMKIVVSSVRIEGASAFAASELLAQAGFQPGSELDLSQLRTIAAQITDFYRRAGFFVARAYLPAQDVRDGQVTITVVEGTYGKVEPRNQSRLSSSVVNGLMGEVAAGQPVNSAPLESSLLLLSDLPGVAVRSTLAPGVAVGTSDLFVDIVPGAVVSGSVDADNQGNRYTGRERLGAVLNLNNPAGLGDVASLRLLTAGEGLKYARASYQVQAGRGKLGLAYAHLDYRLGKEFAALQAHGTAKVASVFGSYPLLRSRNANRFLQLSFDDRRFDDRVDSTGAQTEKKSQLLTFNLNGDQRDLFGRESLSTYQLSAAFGRFDPQSAALRAADAASARAEGSFSKLGFSLGHLQAVARNTYVAVSLGGQFASKNLDASEKMALGGASAVRAYPEGETQADQAYVLSIEARYSLGQLAAYVPGQLQLVGFVDTGTARISRKPWTTADNRRTLRGGGVGVNWVVGSNFVVKAFYAHTIGAAQATSAPPASSRFWLQGVKYF
ncbi:ShlB/FhaC/HecB family hemolysin secretion/activation protein [Pantoea sp. 18069]|uniref:ShlB/FhaC/HecB family hemolysin secretion/activation protein n=1 Tax=Pantoea sp. 18069 TaxID=2681415 RepID=UPI0013591FBB|nr:ShlB/FhaC/HecB family hemolysin secretion/activation protein [Pantoea sp. 18069]